MTLTALVPNETVSSVNTAGDHTDLDGPSDGTVIMSSGSGGSTLLIGFASYTVPAGAVIKGFYNQLRSRFSSSSPGPINLQVLGDGGRLLDAKQLWVNWSVLVTVNAQYRERNDMTQADVAGFRVRYTLPDAGDASRSMILARAFIYLVTVNKPVVDTTSPSGTLTETTQPRIEWTNTLDGDGGGQKRFEAKVYDDSEYGAGGFDPDTTPVTHWKSGELDSDSVVISGRNYDDVDESLPDDTYRAYVRVAQTVNGLDHWSEWDYSQFTITTLRPASPNVVVTSQPGFARVQIALTDNAGDKTTEAYDVEKKLDTDGSDEWVALRTAEGGGRVTADGSGDATVYDYEAVNGENTEYRARAVHIYDDGPPEDAATSLWVQDDADYQKNNAWLFKHPTKPSLNMELPRERIFSEPGYLQSAKYGRFEVLGRRAPVILPDTLGAPEGEMVVELEGDERASMAALLAESDPLLVQAPTDDGWTERWVHIAEHGRARMEDHLDSLDTHDRLTWVEVDSPAGDLEE